MFATQCEIYWLTDKRCLFQALVLNTQWGIIKSIWLPSGSFSNNRQRQFVHCQHVDSSIASAAFRGGATFRCPLLMHGTKGASSHCFSESGAGVGNLPTGICQIAIFFPKLEFKNAGRNFAGANRRCLSKRRHAANQLIGTVLPLCEAGALGSWGIRISVGADASLRCLLLWLSYVPF